MQRTNRMVLGLVAVFVLGSSLALFGCSSDDEEENTTEVRDQATAAALLGGQSFTFADGTVFGVTPVGTTTILAFNPNATRFALSTATRRATGAATYGSCFLTTGSSTNPDAPVTTANPLGGGSTFPAGQGPQPGQQLTLSTCQFNNDTLTLTVTTTQGTATSTARIPTGTGGFGG